MSTLAYKFVKWEVPALEQLKESKVYQLKQKLMNGEKLTRDEKNWITQKVREGMWTKSGICLQGWYFDFSAILKTYVVKQYDSWYEYRATDKTALRKMLYGRIKKIVEVPS